MTAAADEPRNVVVADLGLHVIGVGYQRSVSSHLSLQLDADLYTPWTQNINLGGLSGDADRGNLTGFVLRGRLFVYPASEAPTGFWISPFAQAGLATETRDGIQQQGTVWAVGASVGWALLLKRHLHLALGLGVQYHASHFPFGPGFGRFYPTLDAVIGWAF